MLDQVCHGGSRWCSVCVLLPHASLCAALPQEELIDFLRAASQTMYRVGAMKRMPSLVVLRKVCCCELLLCIPFTR